MFLRLTDLDLAGKRVFIRADLNVPQDDAGNITEDTRIRASVPAIQHALNAGAAVMVTSHLGRPTEGELKPEDSLAPVAKRLAELLNQPVRLITHWLDGVDVKPGEVVMLENCRVNRGEKKNDDTLAKKMAALCDVYVNDAFGTAHRAEATTHGIAKFAKLAPITNRIKSLRIRSFFILSNLKKKLRERPLGIVYLKLCVKLMGNPEDSSKSFEKL